MLAPTDCTTIKNAKNRLSIIGITFFWLIINSQNWAITLTANKTITFLTESEATAPLKILNLNLILFFQNTFVNPIHCKNRQPVHWRL